ALAPGGVSGAGDAVFDALVPAAAVFAAAAPWATVAVVSPAAPVAPAAPAAPESDAALPLLADWLPADARRPRSFDALRSSTVGTRATISAKAMAPPTIGTYRLAILFSSRRTAAWTSASIPGSGVSMPRSLTRRSRLPARASATTNWGSQVPLAQLRRRRLGANGRGVGP